MKLKHLYIFIALAGLLLQSCDDGYEHYDGVYVSGTLGNNPMITLTVDDNFPKSVDLTVASSNLVTKDIVVEMKIDAAKVDDYNKRYQTNYLLLPKESYVLTHPTVVIQNGNYATVEPVKLNIISAKGMVEGRKYMVPVSISKVSEGYGIIEASRTVYIILNQVIVTSALNLGSMGAVYAEFWNGTEEVHAKYDTKALPAVTFEMRTYMHQLTSNWFNTLIGLEENLLIRTTTYNNGGGVLDCTGGGMGNVTSPSKFPEQAWTHVAMTYDSRTKIIALYINGDLINSKEVVRSEDMVLINLCSAYEITNWNPQAKFFIGYSAGGRYLNGVVSEARVWARALTGPEIRNNMCAIDPSTSEDLLAYWRFNENDPVVTQFEDLSGNGFHAKRYNIGNASWVTGVRCPEQ